MGFFSKVIQLVSGRTRELNLVLQSGSRVPAHLEPLNGNICVMNPFSQSPEVSSGVFQLL